MIRGAWNFQDLTGRVFGRLTVSGEFEKTESGVRWRCVCECGEARHVLAGNLRSGRQVSCGCLNRENKEARNNARRTSDDEKKAAAKRRNARYLSANAARLAQAFGARYHADPEFRAAKLAAARQWRVANPEHKRVLTRNRRAKVRGAAGTHTKADIHELFDRQGGECVVCRRGLASGYHVDHVVPISKGGGNGPENLQLLCPGCNLKKSARTMAEFVGGRGGHE